MTTREGQGRRRPSRDQVRVWLTTVIAPMASALAVEEHWATRGNWSFRCETQDFESLWPVHRMVAAPYSPNLEQLLRYRDDVKKLVKAHDSGLDSVRAAARHAYDRLRHHHRFQTLAASAAVSEGDGAYLAEYVVNGLRDLASHHSFHELWSREGSIFLALREDPALTSEFHSLEAAGRGFMKSVKTLLVKVAALQVELADTYRLPPVEPSDAVRV